jgi:hypothetical protein
MASNQDTNIDRQAVSEIQVNLGGSTHRFEFGRETTKHLERVLRAGLAADGELHRLGDQCHDKLEALAEVLEEGHTYRSDQAETDDGSHPSQQTTNQEEA